MGSIDTPFRKVVETSLNFYLDPAKGGHTSYQVGTASYFRRKYEEHNVSIHDIRDCVDQYTLDIQGFQHRKHTSAERDFVDDDQVRRVVYPETEQLLKDLTGAKEVHTFSHMIRRDSREEAESAVNHDPSLQDGKALIDAIVPARFIHVDFSKKGASQILRDNFDHTRGEELSKHRWGIINVWRPIKPISKDPLAICDSRSVRDEDLKPVVSLLPPVGDGQYGNLSGGDDFEAYYLQYEPDQKWYYVSGMGPSEILAFKCYDSTHDEQVAARCPHSAFVDPDTAADVTRESIEIRSLVFWQQRMWLIKRSSSCDAAKPYRSLITTLDCVWRDYLIACMIHLIVTALLTHACKKVVHEGFQPLHLRPQWVSAQSSSASATFWCLHCQRLSTDCQQATRRRACWSWSVRLV
nr:hypothetical protein CFP56_28474 [Quercus suber]